MNITRENVSDLDLRVKIVLDENDYAEKVAKQLKNYRNRAEIHGFRKGMAPMGLIQRMYKGAITADEVQNLLNESLYKYIEDEKLNIVGSPLAND
ncbi:MAG: trigger factor family protein, partial [Bacteroidales bacterium]|nr:trigger factor family protein [Bacteroidales bacterium]